MIRPVAVPLLLGLSKSSDTTWAEAEELNSIKAPKKNADINNDANKIRFL